METITFNKENWSGEEAKLRVVSPDEFTLLDMPDEFTSWSIRDHSRNSDGIVVSSTTPGSPVYYGYWFRSKAYFKEMGVEREHENPMVAFAQLMWNLV